MFDWDFREIGIRDRDVFIEALKRERPDTSELTFTNLFVWRHSKKTLWAPYGEGLVLLAGEGDHAVFYPPVGYSDLPEIYGELADTALRKGLRPDFTRIPEKHVKSLLASSLAPALTVEEDRDNHDYVYHTDSLAYLKGWRLDGKRGFVRKFASNYSYHYLAYCRCMKDKCLKMARVWLHSKSGSDAEIPRELMNEFDALNELLQNYDVLGCVGGVICVEGTPAAFTFGEGLNRSTFVVHFEKADTRLIGSYQTVNQMFVQSEALGRFEWVNREQDLGVPGLRKAKESYVPAKMEKKYNVGIR